MTCCEFQEVVHEFLDASLEPRRQEAARVHVAECVECRHALQRAQALGQAVEQACRRVTMDVTLSHAARREILRAAEAEQVEATAPTAAALAISWWRMFAGAATIAAIVVVALQSTRNPASRVHPSVRAETVRYVVDVPMSNDGAAGEVRAHYLEVAD